MAFTYSKLAESTVGSGGASAITFNNIPQNYTDLCVKYSLRSAFSGAATVDCYLQFNSSTLGYSERMIYNSSGTAAGSASNSAGNIAWAGTMPTVNATASTFGNSELYIPNYASTTTFKSLSFDNSGENNSATAWSLMLNAGLWSNNTAINSITLYSANSSNLVQHSTATLYGIRIEL
jgi:hypothetical protein